MFSLPDQEHASYTDRHNEHRQKHYQNKGLYFNEILQLEAQDFADISTKLGLWRHSKGANEQNPALKDQGENLHLGGGRPSIAGPIDSFYNNEVGNLVDAGVSGSSTCKDNKVCGHMTQVAWQKTRLVGCAQSFYFDPVNGNKKNNWITVCRYWPGGNYSGQRFACPPQGSDDILEEAPYLALPYTINDVVPFTEALLNKELVLIENTQKRSNSSDCSITQGIPAAIALGKSQHIDSFTMKTYNVAADGKIKRTLEPREINDVVYKINDLGQLSLTGVSDSYFGATVEINMTILSQRTDGSYIVELEYQTDEQGSGGPGNVPDASGRGIYLMQ